MVVLTPEVVKVCTRKHRVLTDKSYCPVVIDDPTDPDYLDTCGQPLDPENKKGVRRDRGL